MQKFFNSLPTIKHGLLQSAQWNYAKRGILRNINNALEYYNSRPYSVRSEHILVRLLQTIGVPQEIDLERYYDIVDAKSLYLGMHFQMSSSISYGRVREGIFYGPGSQEILVAVNDGFNPYYVNRNWKSISAVKPILHNKSDLGLMLPDGKFHSESNGVSIIAINIAMLAVQYRAFCKEQFGKVLNGEDPRSPAQFVNMYVLPGMLAAQTDLALFNRFSNLLTGAPMTVNRTKHPFVMLDYTKYVDHFYSDLIDYFDKSERDYEAILDLIPAVALDNFRSVLRLPDWTSTKQINWVELLSRIDAVTLLGMLSPEGGNKLSRNDVNYFLREFKHSAQDNIFNSIIPDIRLSLKRKIKDYEILVGSANNS